MHICDAFGKHLYRLIVTFGEISWIDLRCRDERAEDYIEYN